MVVVAPPVNSMLSEQLLHYFVEPGGRQVEDLVWYFPEPSPEAAKIREHLAFSTRG